MTESTDDPDNRDLHDHGVPVCIVRGAQQHQIDANGILIAAAPATAAERDRLKASNAELLAALKAQEILRSHGYTKKTAEVLGVEGDVAVNGSAWLNIYVDSLRRAAIAKAEKP